MSVLLIALQLLAEAIKSGGMRGNSLLISTHASKCVSSSNLLQIPPFVVVCEVVGTFLHFISLQIFFNNWISFFKVSIQNV